MISQGTKGYQAGIYLSGQLDKIFVILVEEDEIDISLERTRVRTCVPFSQRRLTFNIKVFRYSLMTKGTWAKIHLIQSG